MYNFFHAVIGYKFRNEPHVMTYCHIMTQNHMTCDTKFSHVVAALVSSYIKQILDVSAV